MMFIVFSYYPEIKTCKGTESFGMPPRKTLFSLQKSILQFCKIIFCVQKLLFPVQNGGFCASKKGLGDKK